MCTPILEQHAIHPEMQVAMQSKESNSQIFMGNICQNSHQRKKGALPPSPGHWEFKRMDVALSSLEDNPEQDEKVWGNCDLSVQTMTHKNQADWKSQWVISRKQYIKGVSINLAGTIEDKTALNIVSFVISNKQVIMHLHSSHISL